jgi:hypothetical protein
MLSLNVVGHLLQVQLLIVVSDLFEKSLQVFSLPAVAGSGCIQSKPDLQDLVHLVSQRIGVLDHVWFPQCVLGVQLVVFLLPLVTCQL